MKKVIGMFSVLALACMLTMGFTSCGNEPSNQLRVTNATGSIQFNSFLIVFTNDDFEVLSKRDFGTVNPGESVAMDIPTGAYYFYCGTNQSNTYYWSANYKVDNVKSIAFTYNEVMNWTTNTTSNISLAETLAE